MKRTKIVCTIGPASESMSVLAAMMRAGMNVARLNFSHGTHAGHAKKVRLIRAAAKNVGEPIAILGDLQGPKIRLGNLPEEGVDLPSGSILKLTTVEDGYRKNGPIPVTYVGLHRDVKKGDRILIDDGLIEARVVGVAGRIISAQIMNGGHVTSHKGMNFPDSTLHISAITQKDLEDVVFGVAHGVDWIALSFVTRAEDVVALRKHIAKAARKHGIKISPRIIVKIEKHEAIRNFDRILEVTDAVMVARGDLGVEIPAEDVPVRQKELIEKCRLAGKPVVVATQMLDSMIRNPRPTRAEVSDVANAVFDHTDAVMLSGESATGKYPLQTARTMATIVTRAEASPFDNVPLSCDRPASVEFAVAQSLKSLDMGGHIDAVLSATSFATWTEQVFLAHPEIPFFLATPSETVARQTNLRWGVRPFVMKKIERTTFVRQAMAQLKKKRWIKKGMRIALVLGGEHASGFDILEVK